LIQDWYNPNIDRAKPDFFHQSASSASVRVSPDWAEGMRLRPADGKATAGLYLYPAPVEFVGIKLTQPLAVGKHYRISFQYSHGANVPFGNLGTRIGAGFSVDQENPKVLASSAAPVFSRGWTTFTQDFVADEAYEHLILGNFWSRETSAVKDFEGGKTIFGKCYLFLDNVILEEIKEETKSARTHAKITKPQKLIKKNQTATLAGRDIQKGMTEIVDTDEILVKVYDSKKADGDIVSINYNGQWIVRKRPLKKKPFKIRLPISSNQPNILVLHADNMGTSPPNTATLEYQVNGKKHVVNLRSGLTTSEAITFESL
jgi:hypothetical protein